MTDIDADRLRAMAEAATPGPWEAYGTSIGAYVGPGDCGGCSGLFSPSHEPACVYGDIAGAGEQDAEFIAAADPQTVTSLLDEIRELRDARRHHQYRANRIKAERDDIATQLVHASRRAEAAEAERDETHDDLIRVMEERNTALSERDGWRMAWEKARHRAETAETELGKANADSALSADLIADSMDRAEKAEATIQRIRDVLDRHPRPECDKHADDDSISCGWKHAYTDMIHTLDQEDQT